MIKIRAFETEDIPACAEFLAGLPLFRMYGLTEEKARSLLADRLGEPGRRLYAAEAENSLAGMIDVLEKGMFGLTPYVQQLAVNPKFKRHGIGRALMDHAEEKHRCKYGMGLLVNEDNRDAIRFYEKLGYEKIGRIEGYIRPGLNELVYFKKTASRT